MKKIELFENAIATKCDDLQAAGINGTMLWAYIHSKQARNEVLNFDDTIWISDIEPIVNTCKENGIKEFTISTTMSNLIDVLMGFDIYGFKMNGLTHVTSVYKDITTDENFILPAIKMIAKEN